MLALIIGMAADDALAQGLNTTGAWSDLFFWNGSVGTMGVQRETAIHALMLRGRLDTTVVLHLAKTGDHISSSDAVASPRVLLIPPNTDSPDWDNLPDLHCPAPAGQPNLFCCGHAQMTDGRVLFVGGTSKGVYGHKGVQIFDPKRYSTPEETSGGLTYKYGWAVIDAMKRDRWYPTITPLPDGRMLVSSGLHHFEMVTFGGMSGASTAIENRPHIVELTRQPKWSLYGSIGNPFFRTPPSSRQDHTLVYCASAAMHDHDQSGLVMLYGGRDAGGSVLSDFWLGWRVGFDASESWSWRAISGSGFPSGFVGRYEHSAVVVKGSSSNSGDMYIYGGRTGAASTTASSQLWKVAVVISVGENPDTTFVTTTVTNPSTTGTGPGQRNGHTAVLDEYSNGTTTVRRMLVFGGRKADGTLADDAMYQLNLSTLVWSKAVDETNDNSRARYRHTAVMDKDASYLPLARPRRMVVFGGEGPSGLTNSTMILRRCNYSAGGCTTPDQLSWENSGSQTNPPSARFMHSAMHDVEWNRMVVFGGDSTGSNDFSRVMWSLSLESELSGQYNTPLAWEALPADSLSSDIMARARHVSIYHPRYVVERLSEVFDPGASQGQRWTDVSAAPVYDQWTYPFQFVLPSGNVFSAGRSTRTPYTVTAGKSTNNAGSRLLRRPSASPSTWRWSAGDSAYTSFSTGGSAAVMFEPGRIMKMGQPWKTPTQPYSTITRIEFDANDAPASSGGWVKEAVAGVEADRPQPRVEPNMTMLPDGNVLVSGGRSKHEDDGVAYKRPQIWYPATNTWSVRTHLAEDPSTRGYHSTALLTPDARVISAGGSQQNNANNTVGKDSLGTFAVFSPPYLYSDATTLAVRPPVGSPGHPQVIRPGQVFTVCTDSAVSVAEVALLKPGSATHAFNMDQRYVPLTFTRATTLGSQRLHVTAPASINHAPPGDYFLFLVGASGAQSVGRWMRVETSAGADACDSQRAPRVTDLAACWDDIQDRIFLTWTGVADDTLFSGSGTPTAIEARYRIGASIGNETDWGNASAVSFADPAAPAHGISHAKSFSPPSSGTYYFRLKTLDDNGNWSVMSNQFTVVVEQDSYTECFEGGGSGGGGGGSSMRIATASTRLPNGQPTTQLQNATSLFPRPVRGVELEDLVRLGFDPSQGTEEAHIWVAASSRSAMQLDHLRLLKLDHDSSREAVRCGEGIVTGVAAPVDSLHLEGRVVARLEGGLLLETGQSLDVDLGASTTLLASIARSAEVVRGQRNGVLVQVPSGEGWITHSRLVPRRVAEPVAIAVGTHRVRLHALEDVTIERIERFTEMSAASASALTLTGATSPSEEDVRDHFSAADSSSATLAAGAAAHATFAAPMSEEGLTRTWFLSAVARLGSTGSGTLASRVEGESSVPLRFALHQNQPNPFSRRTTIAFDLPRGESVSLEVFDASGRRVRTLSQGWRPAGSHRVEWDQRDRHGSLVRAGVYLYRLRSAGSGVVERKLVVLP